ncbi:MAG: hypothetical protein C0591_12670 [Marinilabiliales bacterium]|nr:MAG: hypothetical protein C0591_12670 [Marinilabiliales bacterium]
MSAHFHSNHVKNAQLVLTLIKLLDSLLLHILIRNFAETAMILMTRKMYVRKLQPFMATHAPVWIINQKIRK